MKTKKITILLLIISTLLFSGCTNETAIQDQLTHSTFESTAQTSEMPKAPISSAQSSKTPESSKPAQQAISGELKISYLDVGQGDSIYIILPNGKTVLIDAGEQRNSRDIIQYINDSGKDTLDYVIATHPHADHIGGMAEIINALDVKNVYMPKVTHTTATFENLLDTIEAKKLTIQTAKAGNPLFDYGNIKAKFIAPNKDTYSNLNNYSAVLMLSYNDKQFLFMGDAEQESEAEILSNGFNVTADVLKVGHHGSYTASTRNFIKSVKPSIAIISVGKNNSYNHPAPAALSTLNEFQANIWRTDEKGTVIVICDGVNIALKNIANITQPNAPPDTSKNSSTNESKPTPGDKQSDTVYITNTGKKYHRSGCRYLSKSKIPVLLDELNINKYSPCSVCNPPVQ